MTKHFRPLAAFDRHGRSPWLTWLAGLWLIVVAMHAIAQAPAATTGAAPPPAAATMDDLVGRIALYPDDLVAIILPASTSPLQIVQADRYLEKRKADPKLPLDDKWDDAVKTLLNYPEVVKMMSNDLDWTSALGEAVVADQGAVLEGVQSFRRRAQAAGNLKSDDKQVVKAEKEIIIIEPANPEVIYVPQYTPSTVVTYGVAPIYGYYPAPYPSYYYPYAPGAALAAGVIWGAAIGAAWNGGHWGANYGGGDINIDVDRNTNINRNTNVNRGDRGGAAGQRPAGGAGSSTAWKSNKQPGQVSSSVGKTPSAGRPGDARGGAGAGSYGSGGVGGARASTQPGGGAAGAGNRASTQPGGGATGGGASRPGTQPSSGGGANRGGDAFANSSASGRQTQADSSRGASSRSSMSGGGARPSYGGGGGGARGGGGGGRGGGGGGRR